MQTNAPIEQLLARTKLVVRPERYVIVGLPAQDLPVVLRALGETLRPFGQMVVEPDLVTLVLTTTAWRGVRPAFRRARVVQPYRVITFEIDFTWEVVGFLAAVTGALAAAGVPLAAVCGFTKDHLLVHEQHLATAVGALEKLIQGEQEGVSPS